jgi:hypothetical protein
VLSAIHRERQGIGVNVATRLELPEILALSGQPEHVYRFYSVAIDRAGNRQTMPARPQAVTRVAGRRAPRRAARSQEFLIRNALFARLLIPYSEKGQLLFAICFTARSS